ncbi:MAG: hypothetical protein ACYC5N_07235, partial [Endomicrobiales bacterium]
MEDAWDWVQEELKKIQDEIPVDAEMMQVVDAISVADFWKRRYDEERMLWERKLELKEDEKKELQSTAQGHEMAIKELGWRFQELERRWDHEKLLLEDRLQSKEMESSLQKTHLQWEARIKSLEEENKSLKVQLGLSGDAVSAAPALSPAAASAPRQKEREEVFRLNEAEALKRLEQLEAEKKEVASALSEKERTLNAEKEKWSRLEKELSGMSAQMGRHLAGLKEREEEHFVILEDLARGFAHRVRNYLGIISGTMQLSLVNYKMEPELEEQLKIVDQNVQDMLKSIEEFLSLARIPEMSYQSINIGILLDSVAQSALGRFNAQNVTVEKNFAADVPQLKCDQKLFEEGFRHLVENAIEAMPQGGKLTLSAAFDRERAMLSIKVTDTGVGIT